MKKTLFFILFILSFINSFKLSANEKESISNLPEIQFEKSSFSFTVYNKTNEPNDDKFYQKKANGFLAMGITGIVFTSLSLPAMVGIIIIFSFTLFDPLAAICTLLIFCGIGIPLICVGFHYYKKYNNLKMTNLFISTDKNKDINIKFKEKLYE